MIELIPVTPATGYSVRESADGSLQIFNIERNALIATFDKNVNAAERALLSEIMEQGCREILASEAAALVSSAEICNDMASNVLSHPAVYHGEVSVLNKCILSIHKLISEPAKYALRAVLHKRLYALANKMANDMDCGKSFYNQDEIEALVEHYKETDADPEDVADLATN